MCARASVWGQMTTFSQTPSNHGASNARTGPHAMQVKEKLESLTLGTNSHQSALGLI